jgi:hypothetical protein
VDELTGKARDMILKKTSFSASWARAWTPDEGILEHHTHLSSGRPSISLNVVAHSIPLTPMVASIVLSHQKAIQTQRAKDPIYAIPIPLRSTTSCLPLLVARCNDSINTCTNEAIIATEKMSYGSACSYIVCGRHIPLQEVQIVSFPLDTAL